MNTFTDRSRTPVKQFALNTRGKKAAFESETMHFDWVGLAGLCAAALGSAAFLPYIRDTIWHHTRPLRATWLIWSVLSSISFVTNLSEGATTSLAFLASQTGFTLLIFVLSLRYGLGGFLEKGDGQILLLATFGLLLWALTDSAIYALMMSIMVSALGGMATISKVYHYPDSESTTCWAMSIVAAILGILSVGSLDPVLLAYPVYLLVLYGSILAAILLAKARKRHVQRTVFVSSRRAMRAPRV